MDIWHLFVRIPKDNSIFRWNPWKPVQESRVTTASWMWKSHRSKWCSKPNKMSICNVNHFLAINSMQPAFALSCITITCIFISRRAHMMRTCWRAMSKCSLPALQMQQHIFVCAAYTGQPTGFPHFPIWKCFPDRNFVMCGVMGFRDTTHESGTCFAGRLFWDLVLKGI